MNLSVPVDAQEVHGLPAARRHRVHALRVVVPDSLALVLLPPRVHLATHCGRAVARQEVPARPPVPRVVAPVVREVAVAVVDVLSIASKLLKNAHATFST